MIDINEYLERLDEEEGREEQEREAYQRELFEAYVLRRTDHEPERRELMRMYRDGHPLTGPRGLRKRLAAIDLGYFGRAYLGAGRGLDRRCAEGAQSIPGSGRYLTAGRKPERGGSPERPCKVHQLYI